MDLDQAACPHTSRPLRVLRTLWHIFSLRHDGKSHPPDAAIPKLGVWHPSQLMFFRKLLVIRMIAHTQTSTIYLFNQVGVLCLISWMSAQTARGRRAFLTERARKGTLERERARERTRGVAVQVQTHFAWGKRELERKLQSQCRICTQSAKLETFKENRGRKFKLRLNLLSDRQSFNCKDRLQSLAQQEKENIFVQRFLYSWFGSLFLAPVCSSTTVSWNVYGDRCWFFILKGNIACEPWPPAS